MSINAYSSQTTTIVVALYFLIYRSFRTQVGGKPIEQPNSSSSLHGLFKSSELLQTFVNLHGELAVKETLLC